MPKWDTRSFPLRDITTFRSSMIKLEHGAILGFSNAHPISKSCQSHLGGGSPPACFLKGPGRAAWCKALDSISLLKRGRKRHGPTWLLQKPVPLELSFAALFSLSLGNGVSLSLGVSVPGLPAIGMLLAHAAAPPPTHPAFQFLWICKDPL